MLDAATDRRATRQAAEFESWIEAVRVGTLTAHDKKAAAKWQRAVTRRPGRRQAGLTGAALEAAVMAVAVQFPDNVVRTAV